MLDKETCIKLWNDIINECDKQIIRYKELIKKVNNNLKDIKNNNCSDCEERLKKQYNDMLIIYKKDINNWNKRKKNAIEEQKNCNKIYL